MNKIIVLFFIATFNFFSLFAVNDMQEDLPIYFWDARKVNGFSNFGDALSQAVVERIIGREVKALSDPFSDKKKLLAIGSILNYAQNNDVVWGTGINGKTSINSYHFSHLDVRAVRGPLTRKFLLERGIPCPEIYGDPTLLLPLCFPEFQKPVQPSRNFTIIPHFSDEYLFLNHPNMVSVKENWDEVVKKIIDSKFVISSALSGIIVAEAYGIPARLLIVENDANTENLVKYEDYYLGTNRDSFQYATTIEEALEMRGEPPPTCDLEKLYHAFPFDCYKP